MLETQFPGVEHLSSKVFGVFAAVNFVAEDGVAKVMKVDPNLVCPPTL